MKYHRAWQEDRHFFTQMEVCERGSFGACLGKLRGWAEGTTTAAGDRYGQTDWSTSIHSSASSAKTFDDGNETVPTTHLLAERDVWRFASDVASGLAHCHVHGVLHLDIKPENVFISSNGCYKIGDFGVAWIANRGWVSFFVFFATLGCFWCMEYSQPTPVPPSLGFELTTFMTLVLTPTNHLPASSHFRVTVTRTPPRTKFDKTGGRFWMATAGSWRPRFCEGSGIRLEILETVCT